MSKTLLTSRPKDLAALCLMLFALVSQQPAIAKGLWISHPDFAGPKAGKSPVSLQLWRDFDLEKVPSRVVVSVSADNRYVLYVNGARAGEGPSSGDLEHWRFRQFDITRILRRGANAIAAQVWNDDDAASVAQISARTGFWLEAESPENAFLDTGPNWQVRVDRSRTVAPAQPGLAKVLGRDKYYAGPPPETIDASLLAPGWATAASRLTDWVAAFPALAAGEQTPWTLVDDHLPPAALAPLGGGRLVAAYGITGARFPDRKLTIPANLEVTLRLDMGAMAAAYPRLVTSGGKGSRIDLTYAEAPYGSDLQHIADRGDATAGWILGLTDHFLPGGGTADVFMPFSWRAWRYLELHIKTGDAPLTLDSFTRVGTGYPFETLASFSSDDRELNRIWQIGWDTVRLDAHETFMDTAYWERLQYVGDTRIEALVSLAVSGDPRLPAQAIRAFATSRQDGLIQSRWPSNTFQSIPPFALLWVGMLHDYWMRVPDPAPVKDALASMRSSLDWYARYVQADGLVGTTPGWEFIDWRDGISNYPETKDPRETERCIISLMYVGALQQAGEIERALGDADRAGDDRARANNVASAVRSSCWSSEKGLYADQPQKTSFSQHANILAVLYDVAPKEQQRGILEHVLADGHWPDAPNGITPATYYFDFYLARAIAHAGLGERYLEILAPWRRMLAQHFTTWPEQPDPTRSDSHAWSSHPTLDLLTIVAGVEPAAPGFRKVRIEPHLGPLKRVDATYAHPDGLIRVHYRLEPDGALSAAITLPAGVTGEFMWRGQSRQLSAGENSFELEPSARKSAIG